MDAIKNKKDSRIYEYFSKCAMESYFAGEKLQRNFIKKTSKKFRVPEEICRRELKKARVRLYHRLSYLRQNKKVIYLSKRTGLNKEKLIELIHRGDINITKSGINHFISVFYFIQSSLLELENKKNSEQNKNNDKQKETLAEICDFDMDNFIVHLASKINKIDANNYIQAIELQDQDSVFFSIISIENTLSDIIYVPDFKNYKTRQKMLTLLVNELRAKNMLSVKINEGFYSNSVLIHGINKKSKKIHGIFLKKSIFDNFILPKLPVNYENTKITLAKI